MKKKLPALIAAFSLAFLINTNQAFADQTTQIQDERISLVEDSNQEENTFELSEIDETIRSPLTSPAIGDSIIDVSQDEDTDPD